MIQLPRFTALAAVLVGTCLVAQETVGTVTGSVVSKAGQPVAAAQLYISSPVILGGRRLQSDGSGGFRIPLLPPGEYSLTVSKDGFVSSKAAFRITAGQVFRQDFVLRPMETATQVVEVVAIAAQVDKTQTTTSTAFSGETLNTLPVSLTSQGALSLSPGISGSSDRPAFRGGIMGSAQFYVNGISVRDGNQRYGRQTPYVINDLTEDIQVVLSPLNAKFGNTSSGHTNLTTKQGTNEFKGSIRIDLDRGSWDTVNAPNLIRRFVPSSTPGSGITPGSNLDSDDLTKDYQVTLTGPIIPDHLTFSFGRQWSPTSMSTVTFPNQLSADRYSYVNRLQGTSSTGAVGQGYTWNQLNSQTPRQTQRQDNLDVVNQVKLFWLLGQDHQIVFNYSHNKYGPNLDYSSSGRAGTADKMEEGQSMSQSSIRVMRDINYRGVFGNGVLDFQIGQTRKAIAFSSGPLDPVVPRFWASTARSIANNYSNSTQYTTEGDTSSPSENIRQNNQVKLNYNLMTAKHNLDMGYERFQEVYDSDSGWGPNSRAFFTPGLRPNASNSNGREYQVYNFFGSPFASPTFNLYNTLVINGSSYVPEMRLWKSGGGADGRAIDTVDSIYGNDQWTISDNWSVMTGLRLDRWKGSARYGEFYRSQAFSPRFEVKYDLEGNNRHLFSLSYAFLRGTTGNGVLRNTYGQNGRGNQVWRYFWNAGGVDPYFVNQADFQNPNNYKLYMITDSDVGRNVISNLRPEVTKQLELGYKRVFDKGGNFRMSAVYSSVHDTLKRVGYDEIVQGADPSNGQATRVTSNMKTLVTFDPDNVRKAFTLEMQWSLPLYRTATSNVHFDGFYTVTRSRGRVTFGDDLSTPVIRFDEIYQGKLGLPLDSYNAYGEYGSSIHNRLKGWLAWDYGTREKLRSTVVLLGAYTDGSPYSLTASRSAASGVFNHTPAQADTPTSIGHFFGKRGEWSAPSMFYMDLKWTVEVNITRKVRFFTEFTMGNLFNTLLYSYNGPTLDTSLQPLAGTPVFKLSTSSTTLSQQGLHSSFDYGRTYDLSCGLRF